MCPFSEDASLITSLKGELKNLKEEMVQLKNTPVSACCMIPLLELHSRTKNDLSDSFSCPLCFSSQIAPQSLDNYKTGK